MRTSCRRRADQVHLDRGCSCGVPERAMREALEVECATKLVIDPPQQVAVERRGHLQRIVVREQKGPFDA